MPKRVSADLQAPSAHPHTRPMCVCLFVFQCVLYRRSKILSPHWHGAAAESTQLLTIAFHRVRRAWLKLPAGKIKAILSIYDEPYATSLPNSRITPMQSRMAASYWLMQEILKNETFKKKPDAETLPGKKKNTF